MIKRRRRFLSAAAAVAAAADIYVNVISTSIDASLLATFHHTENSKICVIIGDSY